MVADQPSHKNGKDINTVRSLRVGQFEFETGNERLVTFALKVTPKWQSIISDEPAGNIHSMPAIGISSQGMRNLYNSESEVAKFWLSAPTDRKN